MCKGHTSPVQSSLPTRGRLDWLSPFTSTSRPITRSRGLCSCARSRREATTCCTRHATGGAPASNLRSGQQVCTYGRGASNDPQMSLLCSVQMPVSHLTGRSDGKDTAAIKECKLAHMTFTCFSMSCSNTSSSENGRRDDDATQRTSTAFCTCE